MCSAHLQHSARPMFIVLFELFFSWWSHFVSYFQHYESIQEMSKTSPGEIVDEPINEQIIKLNVGGQRFATSANTLSWIPDSFFTSLISGRMHSVRDEKGAIFIDRDPEVFKVILNYMRTKQVDLRHFSVSTLRHEAQYFGLLPLARRLELCEELDSSSCGSVLFQGTIQAPQMPVELDVAVKPTSSEKGESSQKKNKSGSNTPRHVKKSSYELNRYLKSELAKIDQVEEPLKVRMIKSHNTSLVIAYANFACVYKELNGWSLVWTSPKMKSTIKHISINSKPASNNTERFLAISYFDETIALWCVDDNGGTHRKGCFTMNVPVDNLFFVGTQMVALSRMGKVGIWHSATQNWQAQDIAPISCYDTAGSSLLLGCSNGSLNYIDMQKFPLRMKDNDLLVTELYKDPDGDAITAISVFLTPKTSVCGNWIEIAYGTSRGTVRVIVQHPETVGHGPQLFQTYNVHNAAVTQISLTTAHLISVCSEYNHVRSWTVTRFRGMISTQPGTMSLASFKVMTLDSTDESVDRQYTEPGPYGDQDSEQVFIQRVIPNSPTIFVRLASTGERLCTIESVDDAPFTSFAVHEIDGASRIGNRPRRFLYCGTANGSVQMWDLTTAMDQYQNSKTSNQSVQQQTQTQQQQQPGGSDVMKPSLAPTNRYIPAHQTSGGPTPQELLSLINDCDICCLSRNSTPCPTSHPSTSNLLHK